MQKFIGESHGEETQKLLYAKIGGSYHLYSIEQGVIGGPISQSTLSDDPKWADKHFRVNPKIVFSFLKSFSGMNDPKKKSNESRIEKVESSDELAHIYDLPPEIVEMEILSLVGKDPLLTILFNDSRTIQTYPGLFLKYRYFKISEFVDLKKKIMLKTSKADVEFSRHEVLNLIIDKGYELYFSKDLFPNLMSLKLEKGSDFSLINTQKNDFTVKDLEFHMMDGHVISQMYIKPERFKMNAGSDSSSYFIPKETKFLKIEGTTKKPVIISQTKIQTGDKGVNIFFDFKATKFVYFSCQSYNVIGVNSAFFAKTISQNVVKKKSTLGTERIFAKKVEIKSPYPNLKYIKCEELGVGNPMNKFIPNIEVIIAKKVFEYKNSPGADLSVLQNLKHLETSRVSNMIMDFSNIEYLKIVCDDLEECRFDPNQYNSFPTVMILPGFPDYEVLIEMAKKNPDMFKNVQFLSVGEIVVIDKKK